MDGKTPRRSFARRLARAFVVVSVLAVVALAALPWALSTSRARAAIVAAANRAIAPSQVGVGGLSLSWFGPIRLTGLTLVNGEGKLLVEAKQAVLDRGLFALARDRVNLGVLTLDGAAVDVERRGDGSIDLVDALVPPKPKVAAPFTAEPEPAAKTSAGPAVDLTFRVVRGSLRLKTPELAEPVSADRFDLEVRVPSAAGQKLSYKVRLASPPGGSPTETLGVDGELDHRAAGAADLTLAVKGERWPLTASASGVLVRGRLDGGLKAARAAGSWSTSGDARVLELDASGPALSGDRLVFDAVVGVWDLESTGGAWVVRKLGVVSPVGTLSATGSVAPGGASAVPDARVEGRLDIAALARRLPHTLRIKDGLTLEHGSARAVLQVKTEAGVQRGSVEADVSDLVAREASRTFTLRDPAAVTARGSRGAAGLSVEALSVKTAFLELTGSGDVNRGLKLAGTVDLGKFEAQFRDLIDFGKLELAGEGRMAGDYRKTGPSFVGRYAAEVRGLKVVGLTAGPVVRDTVRFDAAVNGRAAPTGLPESWENLRVNLKSSRDAFTVAALPREGVISVNGAASTPVPAEVSSRDGQADLKLVGRWTPPARPRLGPGWSQGKVEFDDLRVGLRPTDPVLAGGAFSLAARGWLDFEADDLVLNPLPAPAKTVAALTVAPGGVKVHGLRNAPAGGRAAQVNLVGDLAAIEQALFVWTGRASTGLGGVLAVQLGAGPGGSGRLNLAATVQTPDLSRPGPGGKGRTSEGPVSLACRGAYDPPGDRLTVDALVVGHRAARVDASGRVDDPLGRRVVDLQGTLAPNWQTVSALAAETIESGARLDGKPRPFRVKGPLSGDSLAGVLKGLDAELGVEIVSADAFGLKLGPALLTVRGRNGSFAVDTIETTLNNGRVVLRPDLTVDEAQGIAVLLEPGSSVAAAEINDEVSRRVLRYVAPVLDEATHVNGKVSVAIDRAEFPLTGPETRRTNLAGQLTFQDVVFAPGPFASQVLSLVGRPNEPGLRLQQPVQLSVADGRVFQKGLEVPIRGDAKVALEGSVGFDESLALVATVPITKGMLGAGSGLDQVVGDSTVKVPIGGTVKQPRIDRRALQVALRELGRNVIKKELSKEASGLLDKLGPPAAAGSGAAGGLPRDVKGLEGEILRRLGPPAAAGSGAGAGAGAGGGSDPLKGLEGELLKRVLPPRGRPR